jgi:hypothetical protein
VFIENKVKVLISARRKGLMSDLKL